MGLVPGDFVAPRRDRHFRARRNAGTSAFAGKLYPTPVRSAGIGWNPGVGRSGQLLSPILGTAMIAADWSLGAFYLAVDIPALIGAAAIGSTGWAQARPVAALAAPVRAEP